MNRLRPRIVSRYPQDARVKLPELRVEPKSCADDADLMQHGLRDYFASSGYSSRVAMEDAALTERVAAALRCAGLPMGLLAALRRLAAIALESGTGAARRALNADLSIEEHDRFAIEGILKSISPRT